ncbi:hypothetical protein EVJ58_g11196 [Rhodofomes roseus]|uniref:Uncharacterized protein n=1 Tax=Rhodofomes roseus TaxID=34475 RepID=A0A4Y9XKA4_9APHY|nr:hypothetical protein EVJ58_g11196 [Rhodofomes roseus]
MHLTKSKNKRVTTPPLKLNILELAAEISALHKSAPIKLTLEVCARIAYLRRRFERLLQEKPNLKNTEHYWNVVDKKLSELRKQKNTLEVSRIIQRGLREDQDAYGTVDRNAYEEAELAQDNTVDLAAEGKLLPSNAAFLTA